MGSIDQDLLITSFGRLLAHYVGEDNPRYTLKQVREIVGLTEADLEEFRTYVEKSGLGSLKPKKTGTCQECGKLAHVADAASGFLRCEDGHKSTVDPRSLVALEIKDAGVLGLVRELALTAQPFEIPGTDVEDLLPFSAVKLPLLGRTMVEDIRVAILLPLKRLALRDACVLLGFLAFMSEDVFIVIVDHSSITEDAESLLAFKSNGAVRVTPLASVFGNPASLAELVRSIPSGGSGETIHLARWIRQEFQSLKTVVSPEAYKRIIEFDRELVKESFQAATHGEKIKFENAVASLFSSVLPTTQLGYTHSGTEVPDGIVIIPNEHLQLVFYDCKSVGKSDEPETSKAISQTDEDEYVRYVDLFKDKRIRATLTAGCFVANEFSEENMLNKAKQIRQRTPDEVRIVFFPLDSLVKLYTKFTTERKDFQTRFQPDIHFKKLLGLDLDKNQCAQLESDSRYRPYSKLRDLGLNAVLVIDSLVDVFLDEVGGSEPMEKSFLPFVMERAKRAATKA